MDSDRAAVLRQRQNALAMLMDGAFKESEPLLRDALEQTLDQKNAETFTWMQRLAECLLGQGKHSEAEPLAHKALKGYLKFGPTDEDVLDCRCLFGECLYAQRKFIEANDELQAALDGYLINLKRGPEHPSTLKARGLLAMTLKTMCKVPEATALAKQNREVLETVLTKAEALQAAGSRRLTPHERNLFQKVEFFTAKALGEATQPAGEKSKPQRTSTIESSISTNAPDDHDLVSRSSSKESAHAVQA